jgi:hypothetical protein
VSQGEVVVIERLSPVYLEPHPPPLVGDAWSLKKQLDIPHLAVSMLSKKLARPFPTVTYVFLSEYFRIKCPRLFSIGESD